MRKVLKQKPGPKSSKKRIVVSHRGSLGESSSEMSDESSPESPSRRSQQTEVTLSEFRTPALENDATDYGLELTTSNLRNPSPRRCSTLTMATRSSQARIAVDENDVPSASLTKSPHRSQVSSKQLHKAKKTSTLRNSAQEKETSTGETPGPSQIATKKRRKQSKPIQLEKRFWKSVRILQNRTDNMIPKLPFSRLVREIMHDVSLEVTKITPSAFEALQTATEMYLTQRLQDAYMLTLHRGRVTLDVRDMQMINYLKMDL